MLVEQSSADRETDRSVWKGEAFSARNRRETENRDRTRERTRERERAKRKGSETRREGEREEDPIDQPSSE